MWQNPFLIKYLAWEHKVILFDFANCLGFQHGMIREFRSVMNFQNFNQLHQMMLELDSFVLIVMLKRPQSVSY